MFLVLLILLVIVAACVWMYRLCYVWLVWSLPVLCSYACLHNYTGQATHACMHNYTGQATHACITTQDRQRMHA